MKSYTDPTPPWLRHLMNREEWKIARRAIAARKRKRERVSLIAVRKEVFLNA